MEHKFAALLRLAADNKDQLFECDESKYTFDIRTVLIYPQSNWRPVKPEPKKIKRWLWADNLLISRNFYTEEEAKNIGYSTKLLWSETEFEVNDE